MTTAPGRGLAVAIRKHAAFDSTLKPWHVTTIRKIVLDLRELGWVVTRDDVVKALRHTKPVGRPRKPPAEHELTCPHCNKPIIVETTAR